VFGVLIIARVGHNVAWELLIRKTGKSSSTGFQFDFCAKLEELLFMPAERPFFNRKLTPKAGVLVVVSLVAAIGLGILAYPVYARARSMSHLRSSIPTLCQEVGRQRQILMAAIEGYKRALNSYPPDHLLSQAPPAVDAATNQLLYELLGTLYNSTNDTFYPSGFPQIRGIDAKRFFNTPRFKNSGEDTGTIGHFLKASDMGATIAITERPDTVALLSFWPAWQGVEPDLYQQIDIGTWCYNSSAPAHNPGGYDLWIQIRTPLTNIIIANW
jgi:hypothetical protein